MPAFSYKERFVPFVVEGSKRQTVRKRRRYPTKKGDRLYHYFGLRTRYCKKLREDICTGVKEVIIKPDDHSIIQIYVDGQKLTGFDRDVFAWNYGFRHSINPTVKTGCWELISRWWAQTHDLPFIGDVIYW